MTNTLPLTDAQLQDIIAKAQQATTHGPWTGHRYTNDQWSQPMTGPTAAALSRSRDKWNANNGIVLHPDGAVRGEAASAVAETAYPDDARYIASVSPDIGQAMAHEILRLREEHARLQKLKEWIDEAPGFPCGCSHEVDKLGIVTKTYEGCDVHAALRKQTEAAQPTREAVATVLRKYLEADVADMLLDALVASRLVRE